MPPPQGNITFVSVLIHNAEDPAPPASPFKRLEWLVPLLRAGLRLVLYVDSFYEPLFRGEQQPGLRIVPFDLQATEIATHIRAFSFAQLPTNRTQAKDTRFFMTLMNTKTELVARAVRDGLVGTPFVAFLDASITKVLSEPTRILGGFRTLEVGAGMREIVLPGCVSPSMESPTGAEELARTICWKFCGGFFLLPAGRAMEWHVACREKLLEFLRRRWLTWEVNLWVAVVESGAVRGVRWFAADHNDSMMRLPEDIVAFPERLAAPAAVEMAEKGVNFDKIEPADMYGC